MVWLSAEGQVKRAWAGAGAEGEGEGVVRAEEVVCAEEIGDRVDGEEDWEDGVEVEEGLVGSEIDAEVEEGRWDAVEVKAAEVYVGLEEAFGLEIEDTADGLVLLGTDDAVEVAVALELTCVCLWSVIYL